MLIFNGTIHILIITLGILFEEPVHNIFSKRFVNKFGVIAAILCLFLETFGNILGHVFYNIFIETFDVYLNKYGNISIMTLQVFNCFCFATFFVHCL